MGEDEGDDEAGVRARVMGKDEGDDEAGCEGKVLGQQFQSELMVSPRHSASIYA